MVEKWGDSLLTAAGVEDGDPGSAVSWRQGRAGLWRQTCIQLGDTVKLGQSCKFVGYAPGMLAGMEWADSKRWMGGSVKELNGVGDTFSSSKSPGDCAWKL